MSWDTSKTRRGFSAWSHGDIYLHHNIWQVYFLQNQQFFPQRHPSSDLLGKVASVAVPSGEALTPQLNPCPTTAGTCLGGAGAAPSSSADTGFLRAPFPGHPLAQHPCPRRGHTCPGYVAATPAPAQRSSGTAQHAQLQHSAAPWTARHLGAQRWEGGNVWGQEEVTDLNTAVEVEQTGGVARAVGPQGDTTALRHADKLQRDSLLPPAGRTERGLARGRFGSDSREAAGW